MRKPRVIFTMTTFMSHAGKLNEAVTALTSLQPALDAFERGALDEILVINEWDEQLRDYRDIVKARCPRAEFVQKTQAQRGQIASLNMILERIEGFDYWLHWEESWVCTMPFLDAALDIMESEGLAQLQVSSDIWYELGPDRLIPRVSPNGATYAELLPDPRLAQLMPSLNQQTLEPIWLQHGIKVVWPLFSLRPSVNRVSAHAALGPFPALTPVRFEWEYGMRWLKAGARKGVLMPIAAHRQQGHVSTWLGGRPG